MKNVIIVGLVVFVSGCFNLSEEELWKKVESAKANKNWDSTRQACEIILKEYPEGKFTSWARFGLAESYRFKKMPREALQNYKLYYEQFPDLQPSALSLFLVGYIYNNDLQVKDSAKYFYQLFLEKFPNHDLTPSVKFELESLGREPNQVLEEIILKQKSFTKK